MESFDVQPLCCAESDRSPTLKTLKPIVVSQYISTTELTFLTEETIFSRGRRIVRGKTVETPLPNTPAHVTSPEAIVECPTKFDHCCLNPLPLEKQGKTLEADTSHGRFQTCQDFFKSIFHHPSITAISCWVLLMSDSGTAHEISLKRESSCSITGVLLCYISRFSLDSIHSCNSETVSLGVRNTHPPCMHATRDTT